MRKRRWKAEETDIGDGGKGAVGGEGEEYEDEEV